jgi:hypothetical protein
LAVSSSHHSYGPLTLGNPVSSSAAAFLGWAQRTSGTGAYQLPALTVDSSTGLVIEAFGLDLATVGTVQTVTATTVTNGGSEAARTYRFAILAETAF